MRFPCLVLDHDDTVVNSTAVIHFPSFLAYLAQVRPGLSYTLDDYFRKNFDPGIIPLFKDELGFTDEELEGDISSGRTGSRRGCQRRIRGCAKFWSGTRPVAARSPSSPIPSAT